MNIRKIGWSVAATAAIGAALAGAGVPFGYSLRMLIQPDAFLVVIGGTSGALLASFELSALSAAAAAVVDLVRRRPTRLEMLVPAFMQYARQARRQGLMAVEREAATAPDGFLARALTLSASGLSTEVVRNALDIEARVCAEREEERAQVFESAAGYAPTLGIIGAVLGLMRVMQQFSPEQVGPGIATAFVATIYGVGAANLVLLPLATRLRSRARIDALRRELVVDGVLALREGVSPGVLEERLSGYLELNRSSSLADVA